MKLNKLRCPSCDATVDIEEGLDVFYCKYCGECIVVSELSKAELNAKVRMKEFKHKETMKDKKYAHKRFKMEFKEKNEMKSFLLIMGTIVVLMLLLQIASCFGEASVKKQEEELQAIVDEIQIDIDNKNFEEAYIKANLLYWDDDYTSDGEEKWDKIRKELLKQIKQAEKEAKKELSEEVKEDREGGFFNAIKEWIVRD